MRDVNAQVLPVLLRPRPPDLAQNLPMREDAPRVLDEKRQQRVERGPREVDPETTERRGRRNS